ncbi:MAG: glycosyltransferase [Sulfuricella sp.]|nr:glycosyltransferase [Sulfuricella sp.]
MIPLGVSCAKAFQELGFEVYCFNSQVESRLEHALLKPANRLARALGSKNREIGGSLPISRINFKKIMLKKAVSEFKPKWVFIIRSHQFVDEELVSELKHDYDVEKVFAWRVDGPLDSHGLLEDAAIYDHYFCIHKHGYDSQKDKIHYLPAYGMDFSLYTNAYIDKPRQYQHEIVFVGGRNRRRQEIIDNLLHLPVEIYGKWLKANRFNWALRKHVKARGIWGNDLVNLYNSSKIVLNISGWDTSLFTGLNLRVFDVPATGAFLLTDYSPELDEYYRVGEEIACFSGVEELSDKLVYYLKNEKEREAIALKGYRKALTLPTIKDRMKSLIETIAKPE